MKIKSSTEIITQKWLNTIGLCTYDISSNSQSDITVLTHNGAINITVDTEKVECNSLTVTAVSSFSWNNMITIFDTFNRILPYITVHEWGWLYGSRNNILLKMFYDYNSTNIVTVGYNMKILQTSSFVRFVENCCDMQVATKLLSNGTVNRSIIFSVPANNPFLRSTVIKNEEDLLKCLRRE